MLSGPQRQEDSSLHRDLHRELRTSQGTCAGAAGNTGKNVGEVQLRREKWAEEERRGRGLDAEVGWKYKESFT